MGYSLPPRPNQLATALQGLAYWMGYRASYFHSYPLAEAALVTEACNLIQSNLNENQVLRPEVLYRRLANMDTKAAGRKRADLSILSAGSPDPYKHEVFDHVQAVIEFKRGSTSEALVNDDLKRLLLFKRSCNRSARAFLVVASEGALPDRFVEDEGVSRLHPHPIPGTKGIYHVRRTVKASPTFAKTNSAHYVCIVEVFTGENEYWPLG